MQQSILGKLIVPQLLKFPMFYRTWRFSTVFVTDCHLLVSRVKLIQSTLSNCFCKIQCNIFPSMPRSSIQFPSGFPTTTLWPQVRWTLLWANMAEDCNFTTFSVSLLYINLKNLSSHLCVDARSNNRQWERKTYLHIRCSGLFYKECLDIIITHYVSWRCESTSMGWSHDEHTYCCNSRYYNKTAATLNVTLYVVGDAQILGARLPWPTTFCTVAPNIMVPQYELPSYHLMPKITRWLPD